MSRYVEGLSFDRSPVGVAFDPEARATIIVCDDGTVWAVRLGQVGGGQMCGAIPGSLHAELERTGKHIDAS